MATAFKSLDPFCTPAAPQPRIRVAFSAGVATQAVTRAAETMPAEVQTATLDELAAGSSALFTATLDAADAARARFNGLPADLETDAPADFEAETNRMCEALALADRASPTSWTQFSRLIAHLTDDGASAVDDDNAKRLYDHATRLIGAAAPQLDWDAKLASYRWLREISDAIPLGDPREDGAMDAYCEAMEKVLCQSPAPSIEAVAMKFDLTIERSGKDSLHSEYAEAIRADLKRLASGERPKPADPHRGWLDERNALLARLEAGDSTDDAGLGELNRLDGVILRTEPASADGVVAQLVMLAQVIVEGAEPAADLTATVIRNAKRLTGMGWVVTDEVAA